MGGANRELKKRKRKAKLAALCHMHTYPVGSTMEIIRGVREGCCVLSKDGWTAEKKELGTGRNPKESPHLKPSFSFKLHELLPWGVARVCGRLNPYSLLVLSPNRAHEAETTPLLATRCNIDAILSLSLAAVAPKPTPHSSCLSSATISSNSFRNPRAMENPYRDRRRDSSAPPQSLARSSSSSSQGLVLLSEGRGGEDQIT